MNKFWNDSLFMHNSTRKHEILTYGNLKYRIFVTNSIKTIID